MIIDWDAVFNPQWKPDDIKEKIIQTKSNPPEEKKWAEVSYNSYILPQIKNKYKFNIWKKYDRKLKENIYYLNFKKPNDEWALIEKPTNSNWLIYEDSETIEIKMRITNKEYLLKIKKDEHAISK